MFIDEDKLREFIADSGIVSEQELQSAIKAVEDDSKDYVSVGGYLVTEGIISEDELKRVQAYILGIPYIDVSEIKIPFETLSLIPEPIARKNNIIAFKKNEDSLEVAMINTDDLSSIDFIKKKTGLKIIPRLTSINSIKKAIVQYQKTLKADFGDIIKKESDSLGDVNESSVDELQKMASDLPVVKIVDTLLKHAILQGASDIHIESTEKKVIVRYRVDGILHDAMTLPKNSGPAIIARIKVLSNLKLDEKRLPQDGRFKIELENEKVSFRVSIIPTYYNEKIVMRILREGGGGYTLETLGFHGEGLEKIHDALKNKTGMVLTTGPTGSGKSTTLYTLMDLLNTPDVNISTIEDPIEYQMDRINQTQVKPNIGFTFASGLRSLVRQDPDVIMVGEIRDGETAGLGVNAALTGHLVLSTLHTNSAAGTIPRLVDMGVQPFLLTSTLKVVIGQRLVRKISNNKEKYFLKKSGIDQLAKIGDLDKVLRVLKDEKVVPEKAQWKDVPFYRPKKLTEDSYDGRIGIHEILNVNDSIRNLIIEGGTTESIHEQAKKDGMLTMAEDGIYKAAAGVTTIEEVLRVVSE
ncbi:type II/IV secretion system protein [Candidatus Parcubacteria bacterium]|nr:type II/IV secretion system protein [Candidatus Parcubacteria bacterium]